jgi:hypothetical protein
MENDSRLPLKQFAFLYKDDEGKSQINRFGGVISQSDQVRSSILCREAAYLQSFVSNFISLRTDFELILEIEQALVSARKDAPSILHSAMVDTLFAQAEAQRRLSNFLSSAAAFRDRALSSISRKYGNPSEQLSHIKGVISSEYDANLSYRVMYSLRNYAVHEQAPIGLMPVNYRRDGDDHPILNVSVMLNRSDLITSLDVNKRVRNELASLNVETFSVKTLADEYFGAHRKILSAIIEMHLPHLKTEYKYFDAIYKRAGIVDGAAPVVMEAVLTGEKLNMKIMHLPMEMIEFFDYIESN